ncbi:MAG: hypothetical protein J0G28_02330 [Afipia sp.]|nr:hypothetical protein [Afipia sp.]OJW66152.1 MAG: hypothetical protein BGO65_03695 [Afipia sp. 64-13]
MAVRETAYLCHQHARWLRPDATRWLKPDAARYLKPDSDVFAVFLSLDQKYNPDQPRVPAGSGRESGRWTDGSGGAGGNAASPLGAIDLSDLPDFADLFALFQIAPNVTDNSDYTQLAGDVPTSDGPELPSGEPPEIPTERPQTSRERTNYLRAAASWLGRNAGLAADVYTGFMNNVAWLNDYHDLIQAGRDEPRTLEELRAGVGLKRPGYDGHHIVEQTWAERFGFSRSEIDDPSNIVSIPRLKHYQITGWYGAPNEDLGGLSPREYLRDKSWEERRRIGLQALIKFEALKP